VTTRRRAALFGAVLLATAAGACQGDRAGQRGSGTADRGSGSAADRAAMAKRVSERCDARDASVIVDSVGIGPVLRGARLSSIASRCTVRDTALVLSEGAPERAHVVTVAARPLVVLTTGTPDTSIIRVIATDPAFKTAGGVGVGSSVQALRLAHGRLCAAQGEGVFVVMAADLPGVSFAIDWAPPASRDPSAMATPFPGGDPGTALDATRITRMWVHGVAGGCRVGVG
jgi:hypothetical protein